MEKEMESGWNMRNKNEMFIDEQYDTMFESWLFLIGKQNSYPQKYIHSVLLDKYVQISQTDILYNYFKQSLVIFMHIPSVLLWAMSPFYDCLSIIILNDILNLFIPPQGNEND